MSNQRGSRRAHRDAVPPQVHVEFLDEMDEQVWESCDQPRRPQWRIRAVAIVLVTAASTAWIVTRTADVVSSTPHAHRITYSMSDHLPRAVARAITGALPGISIRGAAVRAAGRIPARPTWVAGAVDARYRDFVIEVQIVPGSSSTDALVQMLTTGASDMYLIHNRNRSALRTVTITAIAPHIARCPTHRLQRMADALSRMPQL
ncbi:MAG: hypothetical protein J2P17_08375 [Mycobacterium sp.]|nr:hypothetical protein [Mycobacterium sp.]